MGGWCNFGKVLEQQLDRLEVGEAGEGEVPEQGDLLLHHLDGEHFEVRTTLEIT